MPRCQPGLCHPDLEATQYDHGEPGHWLLHRPVSDMEPPAICTSGSTQAPDEAAPPTGLAPSCSCWGLASVACWAEAGQHLGLLFAEVVCYTPSRAGPGLCHRGFVGCGGGWRVRGGTGQLHTHSPACLLCELSLPPGSQVKNTGASVMPSSNTETIPRRQIY